MNVRTALARTATTAGAALLLTVGAPALAGAAEAHPGVAGGLTYSPVVEAIPTGSVWRSAPKVSATVLVQKPGGDRQEVDCKTRGDYVNYAGSWQTTDIWYRSYSVLIGKVAYVSAADVRLVNGAAPYCTGATGWR